MFSFKFVNSSKILRVCKLNTAARVCRHCMLVCNRCKSNCETVQFRAVRKAKPPPHEFPRAIFGFYCINYRMAARYDEMKNGVTQGYIAWRVPNIEADNLRHNRRSFSSEKLTRVRGQKRLKIEKTRVPLTSVTMVAEHDRRSLVKETSKCEKPNILFRSGKQVAEQLFSLKKRTVGKLQRKCDMTKHMIVHDFPGEFCVKNTRRTGTIRHWNNIQK